MLLALTITVAGCGPAAVQGPPDTGARGTARAFFEALIHQDWPAAFATIDPDRQAGLRADAFAAQAKQYRDGHGFEPDAVLFRGCEEQGDQAVAHVVVTGKSAEGRRQFRDSVKLRKTPAGWRIVRVDGFGKEQR
jgi:hypothetical protein